LTRILLILLAGSACAQWQHFGAAPLSREMLALHNGARARVGVAPLIWSDRLAALAQEWAGTLLAHKKFFHRPGSTSGENLFEITGAAASPELLSR
jgi:uncharacterized protein YkwD